MNIGLIEGLIEGLEIEGLDIQGLDIDCLDIDKSSKPSYKYQIIKITSNLPNHLSPMPCKHGYGIYGYMGV